MARTVSIITMGCAKNEVDSAHMAKRLEGGGYVVVDDPALADAVIVNTCSFIQAATEESIEAILDAAELESVKSGRAHLLVAGCMVARYGDDLKAELGEVSDFVSCAEEDDIVTRLDKLLDGGTGRDDSQDACSGKASSASVSAYVKISDGCNRFCSFCTIPSIRGRYRSFTYEMICAEIDSHLACGVREISLIGQDTGHWGDDFDEPLSLAWLVSSLANRYPDTWFRVLYIQPEGLTDELIDAVAGYDNVCSYFDIPLQHVEPRLLARMNRKGSAEEFRVLCCRIRERIPDATLRTTLMAGFPGETEEDFDALCDFVEEAPFDYIGVFAYSREEGTRAYSMDEQIDDDVKMERAQRLRDLADAVCTRRIASHVGSVLDVLICGFEEDGQLFGRTQGQAPDVDGVIYLDAGQPGNIAKVRVVDSLLYELEGELL